MTANSDSAEASASNRTAASTPTDESDVRFVTESTYAATPTPHTSHRRQGRTGRMAVVTRPSGENG